MARFASAQVGLTQAIDTVVDEANQSGQGADNAVTTTSFTATVAQLINGVIRLSGQAAINVTTPTAAQIVAAIFNCQVGSWFEFTLQNNNSGTATVVAGTGVTLAGTLTAPTTNKTQIYKGIVTNATLGSEAVKLVGLLVAGA
jgi:hypothetical protein